MTQGPITWYWDIRFMHGEFQELRVNRVDAMLGQQSTQASHSAEDELPLGEQPSQEDVIEDHEVCASYRR